MRIKHLILFVFSFTILISALNWSIMKTECQKLYEHLKINVPNLNEYVFHSKCGTQKMMEIQKESERKYGSNTQFLDKALEIAYQNGIVDGVAVDLGSGTGLWTKHLLNSGMWDVHA